MIRQCLFYFSIVLFFAFLSSGCVVRTYSLTKDRVDQDLTSGNRGFLKGEARAEEKERKKTRTTQVVEIELHSPLKFEKSPKERIIKEKPVIDKTEDREIEGNRGYLTRSEAPEILEPQTPVGTSLQFEQYTVKKGDTLQKISKKFYGTTKKWIQIYNLNKDVLKAPDKIYAGQVIKIPVESLKETQEDLK